MTASHQPSGPAGHRVLTGSANLSLAAFEGRQHGVHVAFDGEPAWQLFDGYYQRDWKDSVPIETDTLIVALRCRTRATPLALDEVPIVRVLNAGIALVDQPPRPMPAGFAADALRQAASIGCGVEGSRPAEGQGRPHRGQRGVCATRPAQPSGTTAR